MIFVAKAEIKNELVGLSSQEVKMRIDAHLTNENYEPKTKTIGQILTSNLFTYFNFLNLCLALAVLGAGCFSGRPFLGLKNCLFMGVVIINAIISIVEEIISKKIIDRLNLLNEMKVTVLRDGKYQSVLKEELVKDDMIRLNIGNQVVCDLVVYSGEIEVNESFITGESTPVFKKKGDEVLSGSFIVSGSALCKVLRVGKEHYVSKITMDAKYVKKANSVIMDSFEKLLKWISYFIVPIGIVMYFTQLKASNYQALDAIFTTVAALIGMIPEGLILLTSSVMAVSVIRLSKYKVLVQQLPSMETLARVDVICLDKTGTLTKGTLKVEDVICFDSSSHVEEVFRAICNHVSGENETMKAILNRFPGESSYTFLKYIPFSSTRKYAMYSFQEGTYYLGAPEVFFKKNTKVFEEVKKYYQNYRVVALAKKNDATYECMALLLLMDEVRMEAKKVLNYFRKEKVQVKIISGDSLETILQIAKQIGLTDMKGCDVSNLSKEELESTFSQYDIFGRVSPYQKKLLVECLQKEGHTVAMTGDGVNDVMALKASDCGITLKSGSEAARNVSELVLMDSNFDSLIQVVLEGRRTIHNITRSASLLLVKTIYTVLLILISILFSTKYFFVPIQLTLITGCTIGIPSFFLALEPNFEPLSGSFMKKILQNSLPVSLTVLFNILLIMLFHQSFSYEEASTLAVLLTTMTGFVYLYQICRPFNWYRISLFAFLVFDFLFCIIFASSFFNLVSLPFQAWIAFFVFFLLSFLFYILLKRVIPVFLIKSYQK